MTKKSKAGKKKVFDKKDLPKYYEHEHRYLMRSGGELLIFNIRELSTIATDTLFDLHIYKRKIFSYDSLPSYGSADVRTLLNSDFNAAVLFDKAQRSGSFSDLLSVYKYLKVYQHHQKQDRPRVLLDNLVKIRAGMAIADVLHHDRGYFVESVWRRDLYFDGSWDKMIDCIDSRVRKNPRLLNVNSVSSFKEAMNHLTKNYESCESGNIGAWSVYAAWVREREKISILKSIEQQSGLNLSDFVIY